MEPTGAVGIRNMIEVPSQDPSPFIRSPARAQCARTIP
jgi:hypothetical protein